MRPLALDGPLRDTQHLSNFGYLQPGERPHLDNPGLPLVAPGQFCQGVIQRDQPFWVAILAGHGLQFLMQRHPMLTTAAFVPGLAAGMIYQDTPHRVSRDRKEMSTALPLYSCLVDKPEVSLMHEFRRLQRVVSPFAPEVARRQVPQLAVDNRQQLLRDLPCGAACCDALENGGYELSRIR
jgi:hypothetical protein